ncbi:hypothetical protein VFPFJ_00685 [Purpureocillium lilacinum]|uniref:Uncharacterized protein n=1 Tax=Purpureocillium lilacinum TaxID=33203 RepID=A0A179HAT6_PURLI|nr:hypothetical protein VFPFJ_00685 [Purpureocillium lilacinum]OAQ86613.1 hypothetical protein VFPBJ_00653 [Purpureocillium lilacinum]OAQ94576.1 hypothetical protein VFPFJ_00685 [Purpureocillium lilacinum]
MPTRRTAVRDSPGASRRFPASRAGLVRHLASCARRRSCCSSRSRRRRAQVSVPLARRHRRLGHCPGPGPPATGERHGGLAELASPRMRADIRTCVARASGAHGGRLSQKLAYLQYSASGARWCAPSKGPSGSVARWSASSSTGAVVCAGMGTMPGW